MEVDEQPGSGLREALNHGEGSTQLGGLGIHNSVPCLELMDVDQPQTSRVVDGTQLVGGSDSVPADRVDNKAAAMGASLPEIAVKVRTEENGLGNRKRGRPPRGQQKATPVPRTSISSDGEDVCFICFDGGSLVLCDRRGCPKAYHPACIKRDEAFFRSTAKWNCGWHICSSCRKASHYMCYTCTYSLCKGCIKDADYQCVRGSKGLCGTCMKTIMLLEKSLPGNREHLVQVDFDDKSSWEYLFKIYWVYLKQKLSLTLDDLIRAKNPWSGGGTMDQNGGKAVGDFHNVNNGINCRIYNAGGGAIAANSKIKTFKGQLQCPNVKNDKATLLIEGNSWATKELLEFVAHVRNGDTSVLSKFDVQSLVLKYIKAYDLRDPQRKSHIICDRMLMNLFGKQRVGHFEMLKLLEYHFLPKESSLAVDRNSKVLAAAVGCVEEKGNDSYQFISNGDRKRKTCKKADDKKQMVNPDEFAAIDVHNINLIHLSRNLIESMIDDAENFHDKVVDSFVRIRISNHGQKPDVYRLVQVVGTGKSSEPYVIGEKTADVMLHVLNLDKKEAVSIEDISNQNFSQEECRRLRQSVKGGLLKRFTVGEIQKKAMALQALKVNNRLESEILRLKHLCDRASEKGHKKELRECVEKLQLLTSPKERQRQLVEMPEIHVDSTLDPSFKSNDHTKELHKRKQGGFKRACKTGSTRKCGARDLSIHLRSRIEKRSEYTSGQNVQICSPNHLTNSLSNGMEHSNGVDMDKIWHYQDPAGKIQGPFSMLQLQKWSSSGHFPPDLRVWRISEMPGNSILLTDAMRGQYGKNSAKILDVFGLGRCSDAGDYKPDDEWSRNRQSNEAGSPVDYSQPADGVNSSDLRQNGFETGKGETGHSCEKRTDSDCCSGQSSGQNWRPMPANDMQDSRSGGIALSISIAPQNPNCDFPDLPSPTPTKILAQDSVPSWITGLSLVGGRKQFSIDSPTPAKASAEEWDSSFITSFSLKPAEFISDCAAMAASVHDRLTLSSPSHPASNISHWPEITDTDEFNSLGDESVSDLLAEVEAMESLNGLASSTSMMNCGNDLTQGFKINCFSSIGGLSPTLEMARGDALSFTGDAQVLSQSTITIDLQMKVAGHSSTAVKVDVNKNENVSTNRWKDSTGMRISTDLSADLTMETAANTWRIRLEGTNASWGSAEIE